MAGGREPNRRAVVCAPLQQVFLRAAVAIVDGALGGSRHSLRPQRDDDFGRAEGIDAPRRIAHIDAV